MAEVRRSIHPHHFTQALAAAGLVDDEHRIAEIVIRAKPKQAVTIEVTYFADERIYGLVDPARKPEDG